MRMLQEMTRRQFAAMIVVVVVLVAGSLWLVQSWSQGGDPVAEMEASLGIDDEGPDSTTTTVAEPAAVVDEPTSTERVEQEDIGVQETTERYPVVAPGSVKCATEYVHVHPAVLGAHVEAEIEHECHTHTCGTAPHGPELVYSGEPWPCTIQQAAGESSDTTTTTAAGTTGGASDFVTTTEAPQVSEPETVTEPEIVIEPETVIERETPEERVNGGSPLDLARYGDECAGTLTGRYPLGQPTGCVLDNGAVLCLAATHSPEGELLYNAAEWRLCPSFDPDRPPCSTSHDAADHGYIDRWEHVWTSGGRERGVRGFSEVAGVVDLEPGLWFGELCVRNNEGSQVGRPGPQQVTAAGLGIPYCGGLAGFSTNVDGRLVSVGNGTVNLFENHTGRIDTAVFRCLDREGPYSYTITVGVPGDWVLRIGKADLGFEVGTYEESNIEVRTWFRDAFVRNHG